MTENLELDERDSVSPEVESNVEPENNNELLSKDIVSKIVSRERKKAYEKGKQEILMQLNQEAMPQGNEGAAPQQASPQGQSLGGMQQFSAADIERMIAEKTPQLMQQQAQQFKQQQLIDSFVTKMQAAEQKYPGLESQLNDLDYSTLGPVIEMANNMENTGDIMKELIDHPEKMGDLIMLSYAQPRLAQKKLMDLSNSIRVNQEALAQEKQANDPMSQLKPSTNTGMDNSNMSVSDFRKMFR